MDITVTINSCRDCRYPDHSGGFTVGGARRICGHPDACKIRRKVKEYRAEYPMYAEGQKLGYKITQSVWKYHWYNRILPADDSVPEWCPLKHGSEY